MAEVKISASMMCSDLIDLKETLHIFEEEHIDYLHIDMMDGTFVPNFGLGVDYIRGLRKLTKLPLDLHLMIKDPEYKFQWIGINPNDIVSIHYESTFQVQRALDYLQPYGCKRFLALNPATPLSSIEEVLDYIDGINLLMVNPGFSGQRIVPSTIRKAQKLMDYLHKENRDDIVVEVDGNITPEHGRILKNMGASMFVCGTSAIFKGDLNKYRVNIEEFRQSIR